MLVDALVCTQNNKNHTTVRQRAAHMAVNSESCHNPSTKIAHQETFKHFPTFLILLNCYCHKKVIASLSLNLTANCFPVIRYIYSLRIRFLFLITGELSK